MSYKSNILYQVINQNYVIFNATSGLWLVPFYGPQVALGAIEIYLKTAIW